MKELIFKIITIVSILITLAAVGLFIYTEIVFKRELPDDTLEMVNLMKDSSSLSKIVPKSIEMKKMIINLKSRRTRLRFLSVIMVIIPFKGKQIGLLEEKKPIIRDTIIDIVGRMGPSDLNSVAGKVLLVSRIRTLVNQRINQLAIKDILFTHFVVQ